MRWESVGSVENLGGRSVRAESRYGWVLRKEVHTVSPWEPPGGGLWDCPTVPLWNPFPPAAVARPSS